MAFQGVVKTSDLNRAGQLIRLTKRACCPDARVAPGSWNDWVPGALDNHGSLPVDYEITGILLRTIRIGEGIRVWRLSRNGIMAEGLFFTTPIREVREEGQSFLTCNSIYELQAANKG